ncbi:MAG: 50S ribosomal protein L18 [Opitutales bacterium]|nr:50S ribosomal protein L18 [Opitutales bacterium]
MQLKKKQELRQKRVWRVRHKISGTAARPRLCVSFTNKHVYAQAIDDVAGKTLVCVSSMSKDLREDKLSANIASATKVATVFAEKAKAAGIDAVVFDRHGRRYHGTVKAFADAARAAGLTF